MRYGQSILIYFTSSYSCVPCPQCMLSIRVPFNHTYALAIEIEGLFVLCEFKCEKVFMFGMGAFMIARGVQLLST